MHSIICNVVFIIVVSAMQLVNLILLFNEVRISFIFHYITLHCIIATSSTPLFTLFTKNYNSEFAAKSVSLEIIKKN